jgi:TonB dependent receptor.
MVRPFNATTEVLNRWRSESEPGDGKMPRAVKTDPSKNTRTSDRFIYSGTYLRNKLFSIGYTVPKEWVNSISNGNFENIRVYGSVDNLFTITNYPGYNVEQGGDNLGRGKEDGSWPNVRTFRLGVSVAF